jgi:L,D-transpeptidase catalytic domain
MSNWWPGFPADIPGIDRSVSDFGGIQPIAIARHGVSRRKSSRQTKGKGMRAVVRIFFLVALAFGLASCGGSKFKRYSGPAVTLVVVDKSDRKMWLHHNEKVLKIYDVDLGRAPAGHKQFEGEGKTPEGRYTIDRRNPNSRFHLSLGISYPNAQDRAFAEAQGKKPGGEIFIHGRSRFRGGNIGDWTEGCIAVSDKQMEVIYSMIRDGTPIIIRP